MNLLVAALYGTASVAAWNGIAIVRKSHDYYRVARDRMVAFHARHPALADCVVQTTEGAVDAAYVTKNPGARSLRTGMTITARIVLLLRVMLVMGVLGAVVAICFSGVWKPIAERVSRGAAQQVVTVR